MDYMITIAGITRKATEQEAAELEKTWANEAKWKEQKAKELADAQAKKAAAQAKLEALGLTTDDLRALGLQNNLYR